MVLTGKTGGYWEVLDGKMAGSARKKSTTKGDNLKGGLASNSWVLMRYYNMHMQYAYCIYCQIVEVPHFCWPSWPESQVLTLRLPLDASSSGNWFYYSSKQKMVLVRATFIKNVCNIGIRIDTLAHKIHNIVNTIWTEFFVKIRDCFVLHCSYDYKNVHLLFVISCSWTQSSENPEQKFIIKLK